MKLNNWKNKLIEIMWFINWINANIWSIRSFGGSIFMVKLQ